MKIFAVLTWIISASSLLAVEVTQLPSVELTASNAVVHWATDVATGTRAEISPATAKISVPDKTPANAHTVNVSGLKSGTTYTVTVGSARVWLATNTFTATGKAVGDQVTSRPSLKPKRLLTSSPTNSEAAPPVKKVSAPPTRKIWGNYASLPDHFARHGEDFHAQDADDYARQSWEFLQRAQADGLPAKQDDAGVLRIFDPRSGTFASYNRDGTTKTFFKPGSRDYFERQPGAAVKLKAAKP